MGIDPRQAKFQELEPEQILLAAIARQAIDDAAPSSNLVGEKDISPAVQAAIRRDAEQFLSWVISELTGE